LTNESNRFWLISITHFVLFSFDSNNQLHGIVDLIFIVEENIKFGFDLRGIVSVQGQFVHGSLEGTTIIKFQDERIGLMSIKNGVFHGPAIIAGTVPILPVIKYSSIKKLNKIHVS
jgi:hypothetical protein